MEIPAIIKDHPIWIGGGAVAVLLLWQMRKSKVKSTQQAGGGVYTLTTDPNLIAAQQATQQAQLAAGVATTQANDALKLGLAQVHAAQDVTTQAIGAKVSMNANNNASAVQAQNIKAQSQIKQAQTAAKTQVIKTEFAQLPNLGNYYTRQQFDAIAGNSLAAVGG